MQQLAERGIHDIRVLDAMGRLPRERFLPADVRHLAYEDCALPIAENQTISQPYMVGDDDARRCGCRAATACSKIGTGSGYQAAMLGMLGAAGHLRRAPSVLSGARQRLY